MITIGEKYVDTKNESLVQYDLSEIGGHLDYRPNLKKVLQKISFNRCHI